MASTANSRASLMPVMMTKRLFSSSSSSSAAATTTTVMTGRTSLFRRWTATSTSTVRRRRMAVRSLAIQQSLPRRRFHPSHQRQQTRVVAGNGGLNLSSLQFRSMSSSPAEESTIADYDSDHCYEEEPSSTSPLSSSFTLRKRSGVRNVAVIAHVDHGKTTLVDKMLMTASSSSSSSSSSSAAAATESSSSSPAALNRLMDSGELEIERGITITSKVTRLYYKHTETTTNNPVATTTTINCVDTPGHADFCGEVDRILSMVDGVLLVVDASEGPKSQTKYVLGRALSLGLQPVVVLNKCDRPEAAQRVDSGETENQLFDLFVALGATEEQLNYSTVYCSAKAGWATLDPTIALDLAEQGMYTESSNDNINVVSDNKDEDHSMKVLLDCIINQIPLPAVRTFLSANKDKTSNSNKKESLLSQDNGTDFADDKFSLASTSVAYDQYLGRTCTGRIMSGSVAVGDSVTVLHRSSLENDNSNNTDDSSNAATAAISGLFVYEGIDRKSYEERAYAGDIVTLAGVPDSIAVGDTLTGASDPVEQPIDTPPLVPPTLCMEFGANDGPLAGKEGKFVASSKVRDRLISEADNNVTLGIESTEGSEKTTVAARGELQLGILVEQMRREGYELIISPPQIITKTCPENPNVVLEPFEEVTVDVASEYSGAVVSALTGDRKGTLMEMNELGDGKCRLVFEVPSRGLLGFNNEIATATRGSAVVNHLFLEDRPHAGHLGSGIEKGKLVCNTLGKASTFALSSLSARGTLFVEPGDVVYPGMVIGESAKSGGDMEVNPTKEKEKNNMRTVIKDDKAYLAPPVRYTVEELIGYMNSDEIIEVTPKSVRLRKLLLDSGERERAERLKSRQRRAAKEKKAK